MKRTVIFRMDLAFTEKLTDEQIRRVRDRLLDALIHDVQTHGPDLGGSGSKITGAEITPRKKTVSSITLRFAEK